VYARQQGQRVPAVGVADQPRHQLLVHLHPGQPRRTFDDRTQCLTPQRPQRMQARREDSQVRVGEQLIEELRAKGGHDLHRSSQRRTKQCGKPCPLGRSGPGEQLLKLVKHYQQVPSSRSGSGQEKLVGKVHEPAVVEPAADVGKRPSKPRLAGRRGEFAGQCGHWLGSR
jgi:hypothetical protein